MRFQARMLMTVIVCILLVATSKVGVVILSSFDSLKNIGTLRPLSLLSSLRVPCLNDFIMRVESTLNLQQFCDDSWNKSDILCKQFLVQNGLEIRDNCLLPPNSNLVPRIVYYSIFSPQPGKPPKFMFLHYLSILSAKRYTSPWAIYVISDTPPSGYWWMRVLNDVKGVRHLFRPVPVLTKGELKFIQQASDFVRLQALIVNGGIYLDTDMILVNSIDPLLNISLSMGLLDMETGMGNAFIVAERGCEFIKEWYLCYRHFNNTHIYENSLWTAKRLWLRNRTRVFDVADKIYRPNWNESWKLFKTLGYDWRSQYGVHVWHTHGHVPENPDEMDKLNTTLGEIFRYIYYGKETMHTG